MSCGVGCRCSLGATLLCPWHRLAAVAPIQPLAWEPPYAMSEALKRQKKKRVKTCLLEEGCWNNSFHWNCIPLWRQNIQSLFFVLWANVYLRFLFSVFLLLILPVAVLFLGRIWCDPSPLPTQGLVPSYKAHLYQNTKAWAAGSSDKTWHLTLKKVLPKNQYERNQKALPSSSLKCGLHLAACNGHVLAQLKLEVKSHT